VFRSDVKGYYEAIDHDCLLGQLRQLIRDPLVLKLLQGYMQHLEDDGGILRPVNRGISLCCPLWPLMSALYLKPLDHAMVKLVCFTPGSWPTGWSWHLRGGNCARPLKKANQVLEQLQVEKHPDKTFIGRVDRGIDFLGLLHTPARNGPGCG
jgi:hypothetical protein